MVPFHGTWTMDHWLVTSIAPGRREKPKATSDCLRSALRAVTVLVSWNVNRLRYLQIVSYEFGVYIGFASGTGIHNLAWLFWDVLSRWKEKYALVLYIVDEKTVLPRIHITFQNTDVSNTKIYLHTFVFEKGNLDRREYSFLERENSTPLQLIKWS
jgi:hypothetical protein